MASIKQFELFVQPESLKKTFAGEEDLMKKKKSTKKEHLSKGFIVEVKDAHDFENRSKNDTYLNIRY